MVENEQEYPYLACAMKLASEYPALQKEHDRLVKRLEGNWIYTKEMAIADLDRHSVSYDRDRVQSSNISSPAERIAMAMTNKFMQKKQEELDWERQRCIHECRYVDWKMNTLETIYRERLDKFQQQIFALVFMKELSFREIRAFMPGKTYNYHIVEAKEKIWKQISRELQIQEQIRPEYIRRLELESGSRKGNHKNAK